MKPPVFDKKYDVAIIGGGLAGLSFGILSAQAGYSVIVFEKEVYPFHKVCGEYISNESVRFMHQLGLDIDQYSVPQIKNLLISSSNGNTFESPLDLGGIGISRYLLDSELCSLAKKQGVAVLEKTKVTGVHFDNDGFVIQTNECDFIATVVAGTFGKKSNLDAKWKRPFLERKRSALNQFIAVKYHVCAQFPDDVIALHNFHQGYCGISKVEGEKYCLCYMTTAKNLRKAGNDIERMEKEILSVNPHLKYIFEHAEKLMDKPVTISQINFEKKEAVYNHVLMLGDAAGMIAPLCGNGMSMAFHSAKICFGHMHRFLSGEISRQQMEALYQQDWNRTFSKRLWVGRKIQHFFGRRWHSNFLISLSKQFPFIARKIIASTHGKEF